MSTIQQLSAAICRPTRGFQKSAVRQHGSPARLAHRAILALDAILRRHLGIFEFSSSPDCLLRIAMARASLGAILPGGMRARKGDALIELHLWNEHVAELLSGGSPLGHAKGILRDLRHSLELLARYLRTHPETAEAALIHARVALSLGNRRAKLESFARAFGFAVTCSSPRGMARVHDFFEDFLIRWLLRAFNPSRPGQRRPLQRAELWMTRECLLERYAAPARVPREEPLLVRAAASSSRA
jgi:YkoP domain